MENVKYIGGKVFENIEVDERVNSNLIHCLYCKVTSHSKDRSISNTDYQIGLMHLDSGIRQCPACKRVYITTDPTKKS